MKDMAMKKMLVSNMCSYLGIENEEVPEPELNSVLTRLKQASVKKAREEAIVEIAREKLTKKGISLELLNDFI